jgi:hypothetical protein
MMVMNMLFEMFICSADIAMDKTSWARKRQVFYLSGQAVTRTFTGLIPVIIRDYPG